MYNCLTVTLNVVPVYLYVSVSIVSVLFMDSSQGMEQLVGWSTRRCTTGTKMNEVSSTTNWPNMSEAT